MKRALVVIALVASACSSAPKAAEPGPLDGPVGFRVLSEKENPSPCNDAPDVSVAKTDAGWIDVFDQQTSCTNQDTIDLPDIDFASEVGVAVWWKKVGCLGFVLHTDSIERAGNTIDVRAHSTGPSGVCAQAIGQLESFLAVQLSVRFTGAEPIRFILDGTTIATANAPKK
ncbi:MAG: hypothetical protein ABR552_03900 [Actinomycetota bacterium]